MVSVWVSCSCWLFLPSLSVKKRFRLLLQACEVSYGEFHEKSTSPPDQPTKQAPPHQLVTI